MKFPDESAQNRFDWKQSKDFIGEIEGFLAILEDRLMEFKEIEFRGMTLTEEDLIQLFYYKFTVCSDTFSKLFVGVEIKTHLTDILFS